MTKTNNIAAGRIANALVAAVLTAAEREVARLEASYTATTLDVAYEAAHPHFNGHTYFPAATEGFKRQAALLELHHKLVIARGRIARDRRVGQLELAL